MINAWYPNWPLCPKEVLQWYMDLRTWWPGIGGSIWKILQYQYNSRTTRWLIFWWHSSVSHRAAPSSCLRPLVPQLWESPEAWVEGRWVFQRFSVTWTKREPRTWWSTSSWTRQVTESSRKASCWLLLCWKEETPPFRWDDVTDVNNSREPRLLNDIYGVPLPVLRLVFNIDDHLLARYLSDPWSQLTGFTPCRSVWHTDSSEALFLPPQ